MPRNSIDHPEEQPDREQDLPEAAEVEVLEALVAEPGQMRRRSSRGCRRARRPGCPTTTIDERAEQRVGEHVLPRAARGRRSSARGRSRRRGTTVATQKIASCTCQVRSEVVGQALREVDAEEARRARRGSAAWRAPTSVWSRNSAGHDEEEPGGRALRRGQRDVAGRDGTTAVCCSRPCQPRKFQRPNAANRSADPAEQGDEREHAPDDHVRAVGSLSTSGSGGQLLVYE